MRPPPSSGILQHIRTSMSTASQNKNRGSLRWMFGSFAEFSRASGMSPVATEERRMLPLGGGLKRSASFVISVDEVEVLVISFIIRSTFYVNSFFYFLTLGGTFWFHWDELYSFGTFNLLLVLFGSLFYFLELLGTLWALNVLLMSTIRCTSPTPIPSQL